ncbi:unnamed protein product [Rotaria sp. Silwood1]|nr:unnamed protein product [Rotaria sp. Silwood1]
MAAVLPASIEHLALLSNFAFSCKITNPNMHTLFDVIWIVVPDIHYNTIYDYLLKSNSLHSVMRIVRESSVLPDGKKFGKYDPWFTQQDIKLGISAFIRTEFYLCFDADIMCGRELNYRDLFAADGRARTSEEKVLSFYAYTGGNLNKTCSSVKFPLPTITASTRMMAFTPLPFYTHILFSLADFLEHREREPWIQYLMRLHTKNKKWTEYTLYWVFGIYINAYNNFHYPIYSKEFCVSLGPKEGVAYKWFSSTSNSKKSPFVGVNDHDKALDISQLSRELRVALLKQPRETVMKTEKHT